MATYLYRIGKFAYRRKGVVLTAWLALMVLVGVGAATLSGPTSESFSIPGTPAQNAQDLMAERFPAQAEDPMNSLSARYVFEAPQGQTLDQPQNKDAMDAVLSQVRQIPQVKEAARVDPATAPADKAKGALVDPVVADQKLSELAASTAEQKGTSLETAQANAAAMSPLSKDKTVGFVQVPFDGDASAVTDDMRNAITHAADAGRAAGLNVQISGTAASTQEPPGGATELVGIAVAAVVLMVTFGSLVAAGLPLITAIIGIMIGSLAISIATGFTQLSSMTPTLAIMIGLAVAIDYSLFIVSRYRHEISVSDDREEAAGRAVGTAGSAVVFAGLTVIIALIFAIVQLPEAIEPARPELLLLFVIYWSLSAPRMK